MLACCAAARADLTCEQLAAIGRTAIQLRNEGASLSRVLADIERSKLRERYTPDEVNAIRQAVRMVYTSEFSVDDLMESCTFKNKPKD